MRFISGILLLRWHIAYWYGTALIVPYLYLKRGGFVGTFYYKLLCGRECEMIKH